MFELLGGRVTVQRLREVEIADLLRRPQVSGPQQTAAYLAGRRVLVTGAGGSIGLELCRQVAHAGPAELVLVGHGENSIYEADVSPREAFPRVRIATAIADIRDADRVHQVFAGCRPEIVFHAAAHKHVPLMEKCPEEAVTNNILGTHYVLEAALATGTERFVLVSTDKAVEPRSRMGATKRVAEQLVTFAARRSNKPYAVVRFGNVLGSRGSVVPRFRQQMEAGGPITLTHPDMTRFFMTIPEAVHLVLCAGGLARAGELFVLNMGEPIRIAQLAQDLITLSGYEPGEIPIAYTGVRPGEKLEERLWEQGADVSATNHPEILQVDEQSGLAEPVPIAEFAEAARVGDHLKIDLLLTARIPTYVPATVAAQSSAVNDASAGVTS
jgi:FlaA1/EpsC-like NDP-sugar epimerase